MTAPETPTERRPVVAPRPRPRRAPPCPVPARRADGLLDRVTDPFAAAHSLAVGGTLGAIASLVGTGTGLSRMFIAPAGEILDPLVPPGVLGAVATLTPIVLVTLLTHGFLVSRDAPRATAIRGTGCLFFLAGLILPIALIAGLTI